MVAEDEAVIRLDLVEALIEAGYDVVEAVADGEAALTAIAQHRPDVVLVDIAMPGLDGIEVTRQVSGEAAVVVITAFGQRELVERATQAGAMGYLVKPVGPEDLMPAIEVALARWTGAQDLRREASDLERRLAERRDVERAKGILISAGMSEEQAFAALRQRAMDARCTLGEMARRVIDSSRDSMKKDAMKKDAMKRDSTKHD